MKKHLFIKVIVGLPLLLLVDYIIFSLLGCASCLLGLGEDYFCGTYCQLGKILLGVSFILYGYYLAPDVIRYMKLSFRKVF